jgi:hypothetical protein
MDLMSNFRTPASYLHLGRLSSADSELTDYRAKVTRPALPSSWWKMRLPRRLSASRLECTVVSFEIRRLFSCVISFESIPILGREALFARFGDAA